MNEENKQNVMEDPEDLELKGVLGKKFMDQSNAPCKKVTQAAPKMKEEYPVCLGTAADHKRESCVELGEWSRKPMFVRAKNFAKHGLIFGSLVAVFWYWNLSGQMAASAAIPCMVACGALGGFNVGKVSRG